MKMIIQRVIAFLVGSAIVTGGIIFGLSSGLHSYHAINGGRIKDYIIGNSSNGFTDYFTLEGNSALFLAHETDFAPQLDAKQLSVAVSLAYRTDAGANIDVSADNGLEMKGFAFEVEEITALGSGQSFATEVYMQHPTGVQDDFWPFAYGLIALGVITILFALFMRMNGGMRAGVLGRIFGFYLFLIGLTLIVAVAIEFLGHSIGVASLPRLDTSDPVGLICALIAAVSFVPVGWLLFRGSIGMEDIEMIDL